MKAFKKNNDEMKKIINKLEHDAQITLMVFHYGKAAYDRGHHWLPIHQAELCEYTHYWIRRLFLDLRNHPNTPVLCEWKKSGWVDVGHSYLDATTDVDTVVEVWGH